jgi:hypothetical protein
MIVVPVLITNCQFSEYLNTGPNIAQIITEANAIIIAGMLPVALVTWAAQYLPCLAKFATSPYLY